MGSAGPPGPPGSPTSPGSPPDADASRVQYSYAMLRVVPHPHLDEAVDVGVVVHSRPADFLGLRVVADPAVLSRMVRDVDIDLLARYLATCAAVAAGDYAAAGPIALLSAPERFHWITSPRSDVIQPSAVHVGLTTDPTRELEHLFETQVRQPTE